jgi:ferredoxin-NADP reductase
MPDMDWDDLERRAAQAVERDVNHAAEIADLAATTCRQAAREGRQDTLLLAAYVVGGAREAAAAAWRAVEARVPEVESRHVREELHETVMPIREALAAAGAALDALCVGPAEAERVLREQAMPAWERARAHVERALEAARGRRAEAVWGGNCR